MHCDVCLLLEKTSWLKYLTLINDKEQENIFIMT